jgi:hypothetical protein
LLDLYCMVALHDEYESYSLFFDVSWTGLGFDNELKEYEDDGGIVEFSHALVRNTHLRHLRMFGVVLGHVASAALAGGVRRFRPTCSMRSTV